MKLELRAFGQIEEIRANANGTRTLKGYGARFNTLSLPLNGFREKIAPSAFDKTLRNNKDVRLLAQHDWSKPMARQSAGTLNLYADDMGLRSEAEVDPGISYVDDLLRSIERGDISGTSFGFNVDDSDGDGDTWDTDNDGNVIRTLRSINLSEISVVSSPAYEFDGATSLRSCPSEIRSLLNVAAKVAPVLGTSDDDLLALICSLRKR